LTSTRSINNLFTCPFINCPSFCGISSVVDVVDVPAVATKVSIIIYLVVVSGTNPGLVIVSVLASLDVITTYPHQFQQVF
jgi:hypothetical protein